MGKWDYEAIRDLQQDFYTEFKETTQDIIKELIKKYLPSFELIGGTINSLDFVLALQETFKALGYNTTSWTDLDIFQIFRF